MNTRERLEQFHALVKEGKGTDEIRAFVDANQADKRFISLIDLREAFLAGFKKELEESIAQSMAKREDLIEHEMQEYALDLMNYASTSARERTKRLAAVLS